MHEIIFHSMASRGLDQEGLLEIVATARKNNAEKDVTGCMLYYKGEFLAIHEGKKEVLLQMHDKIARDVRHDNFTTLYIKPISERTFASFSMAFLCLDPGCTRQDLISKEQFAELLNTMRNKSTAKQLFILISENIIDSCKRHLTP